MGALGFGEEDFIFENYCNKTLIKELSSVLFFKSVRVMGCSWMLRFEDENFNGWADFF